MTTIKIIPLEACNSGEKRVHVPVSLEATCPKCSCEFTHDYTDTWYFGYPWFNSPGVSDPRTERIDLYCCDCGHEWCAYGAITVTLTIVEELPDGDQ